jgi:hypothetical protein
MGYGPEFKHTCGAPWTLLAVEGVPAAGQPLDSAVQDHILNDLCLRPGVSQLTVGDHVGVVFPSERAQWQVRRVKAWDTEAPFEEPTSTGPALMVVLEGDEDSMELLSDSPSEWTRTGVQFALASGAACMFDPVYAPLDKDSGEPTGPVALAPGTYEVFELKTGNLFAVWIQQVP